MKGGEDKMFRNIEGSAELTETEKKLAGIAESLAKKLLEEKVPVLPNLRIDMATFEGIYPESMLAADKQEVERLEGIFRQKEGGSLSPEEYEKSKLKKDGEKLEILKTVILNKFLNENFVVVRTSTFDDYKNGTDNIIMERETGNVVCALDEASDTSGRDLEAKKQKILMQNIKQGGNSIKYGITKDGESLTVGQGPASNVPMFYLTLPPHLIERGIKETSEIGAKPSDNDKNLFKYFMALFDAQLRLFKLEKGSNEEFKKKIETFKAAIKKVQ